MGKWAKKQVYLHFCQSVTLPPLNCKGLNQGLAEFFFRMKLSGSTAALPLWPGVRES